MNDKKNSHNSRGKGKLSNRVSIREVTLELDVIKNNINHLQIYLICYINIFNSWTLDDMISVGWCVI